ncbi:MAG: DNA polymerase IV [Nitrospiraceae bacterium]
MERQILCFHVPLFGIALARADDASLNGRPVATAPMQRPRARLCEVSHEALAEGLFPGMTVDLARHLCPSLRIVLSDPLHLRTAHGRLQNLLAEFTPLWEPVRPGSLFLDLTGTTRLHGPTVDAAARVEREVARRHRLAGVIGIAGSKLVAHLAAMTLERPPQLHHVESHAERAFLAPLSPDLLPGLQRRHASRVRALLDDLNLRTLGAIAEVSLPALERAMGPTARLLHEWAQGIDPSPVHPPATQPALEWSCALDPEQIDDQVLLGRCCTGIEYLCRTLRRQQRVCRRLALIVRYRDQQEVYADRVVGGTCWEMDLLPALTTLFFRCVRRRVCVQRIILRAEQVGPPAEQLTLFDLRPVAEQIRWARRQRLCVTLDALRDRFGERAIRWGRTT